VNNYLHLIPATGWRIRIFDLRDKEIAIRDVAAFALKKDGEVVPLIHIINGVLETPPPSSDAWVVDLLGPSDGDTMDLPLISLQGKLKSETPLDQRLSKRGVVDPPERNPQSVPKDTRTTEIQIFAQIDSAEREIDRGMDTERLLCRCTGPNVLGTIERLYAEHLIYVDPREHQGCGFYRLTDKAKTKLRDFENAQNASIQ
jgi:hypothetical protein